MELSYQTKELHFIKPARTSKTAYLTRQIILIHLNIDGKTFTGECAPLPHLSTETIEQCETELSSLRNIGQQDQLIALLPELPSSLRFAIEGALLEHKMSSRPSRNQAIKINGLVWMNQLEHMESELHKKVEQGFDCIKIKVGQHDFDAECRFLEKVRKQYGNRIQLRLDANGAFNTDEALLQLNELSRFDIHSLEQPIAP